MFIVYGTVNIPGDICDSSFRGVLWVEANLLMLKKAWEVRK